MKKINIKLVLFICVIILIVIGAIKFLNNNSTKEDKLNIKKSEAKTLKLVNYDHENFTMKIPDGWEVSTSGDDMYFAIRVYNPNDDRYQIYSVLKAEPFLKNDQAKAWYENYYNAFGGVGNKLLAKAIVLSAGTVEDFYSNFNSYIDYVKTIDVGNTFKAPDLKNFSVVEEYSNNSMIGSVAKDDKILRATFQDSKTNKNGEGLFMATIVDMGSNTTLGYDVLYYTAYNVIGISTGENDLVNYEGILTESLNSLTYKDSFINSTIKNSEEQKKQALQVNSSIQQAYDSYNSAWTNRQKTYDITSQKNSDSTLGYERVYDTETGEIYKAYNGFMDNYTGNRYEEITNDMYTEAISGYIEK